MFKKISYFLTNYKVSNRRINSTVTFKKSLQATFGSLLMTLVIFLIPGLLVYNLLIFPNLNWLIYLLIFIIFVGFSFTYNIFYIKILKTYYPNLVDFNFKNVIIVEATIAAIVLVLFGLIVISIF